MTDILMVETDISGGRDRINNNPELESVMVVIDILRAREIESVIT